MGNGASYQADLENLEYSIANDIGIGGQSVGLYYRTHDEHRFKNNIPSKHAGGRTIDGDVDAVGRNACNNCTANDPYPSNY